MFPLNKRTLDHFTSFFRERKLVEIADMQTAQVASKAKKDAVKCLADMIKEESSDAEVSVPSSRGSVLCFAKYLAFKKILYDLLMSCL